MRPFGSACKVLIIALIAGSNGMYMTAPALAQTNITLFYSTWTTDDGAETKAMADLFDSSFREAMKQIPGLRLNSKEETESAICDLALSTNVWQRPMQTRAIAERLNAQFVAFGIVYKANKTNQFRISFDLQTARHLENQALVYGTCRRKLTTSSSTNQTIQSAGAMAGQIGKWMEEIDDHIEDSLLPDALKQGYALVQAGKLDAAVQPYESYLSTAPRKRGEEPRWSGIAYSWLAWIETLRGNLDAAAELRLKELKSRQRKHDLNKDRYREASSNPEAEHLYLNNRLFNLCELFSIYWNQGKLGVCRVLLDNEMAETEKALLKAVNNEQNWGKFYTLISCETYSRWKLINEGETRFDFVGGNNKRGIAALTKAASEIEAAVSRHGLGYGSHNNQTLVAIYSRLAGFYEESGFLDEAITCMDRADKVRINWLDANFKEARSAFLDIRKDALYLLRDGNSTLLNEQARLSASLEKGDKDAHVEGLRTIGVMFREKADYPRALESFNSAVNAARNYHVAMYIPRSLRRRAETLISLGRNDEAVSDITEALTMVRGTAFKIEEPYLYQLYGRVLAAKGSIRPAFMVWEMARNLACKLGMDYLALDVLCDELELQMKLGFVNEARSTLARIKSLLETSDNIGPYKKRRIAILQPVVEAWLAGQTPPAALAAATITPKAAASTDSEVEKGQQAMRKLADGTLLPNAGCVILQPRLVQTQIASGEVASTRFQLYNASFSEAMGTMSIESANSTAHWKPITGGVSAALEAGNVNAADNSQMVRIDPGAAFDLHLISDLEATTNRTVKIRWVGANTAETEWQVGLESTNRLVAVVDASLIEENALFYIPFFHTIHFRKKGAAAFADIKVKTSQPCRVELYDYDANRMMAIDATGDGSFDGFGDSILIDGDKSGMPDIATDGKALVRTLELWVFPFASTIQERKELEISVYTKEGQDWQLNAVDSLSRRKN